MLRIRKDEFDDTVYIAKLNIIADRNNETIERDLFEDLQDGTDSTGRPLTDDEKWIVIRKAMKVAYRSFGYDY